MLMVFFVTSKDKYNEHLLQPGNCKGRLGGTAWDSSAFHLTLIASSFNHLNGHGLDPEGPTWRFCESGS